MPQVKIRHAMANWQDENNISRSAFRGEIVDLPQAEIDRLKPFGALSDAELELDRPGVLQELSQSPDDQELLAWVMAATVSEIALISQERPQLVPRLKSVTERIVFDRALQDHRLEDIARALNGELSTTLVELDEDVDPEQYQEDIILDAEAIKPATGGFTDALTTSPPTGLAPPLTDFAELVTHTVEEVAAYVNTHPFDADAVLVAETEAHDGTPRAGVAQAVRKAST